MSQNLGDLLKAAGLAASPQSEAPAEPSAPDAAGVSFGAKVVLRATRAGRGGKTVTEIQGVLSGHDALARELKKQLGLGVKVEGELLVAQGDQRDRLEKILTARGVKKIVR